MICTLAWDALGACASPKASRRCWCHSLAARGAAVHDSGFNTSARCCCWCSPAAPGLYLGANRTLMETLRSAGKTSSSTKTAEADRSLAAALSELRVIFDSAAVDWRRADGKIARAIRPSRAYQLQIAELTVCRPDHVPLRRGWAEAVPPGIAVCASQAWVGELELVKKDLNTFWAAWRPRLDARTRTPDHTRGARHHAAQDRRARTARRLQRRRNSTK